MIWNKAEAGCSFPQLMECFLPQTSDRYRPLCRIGRAETSCSSSSGPSGKRL